MRFYHNGPNIPDSLLDKRDKGQVVFICGAGVSIPANMPDFSKLTRDVIDFFDPPETSPITQEFKPWREWIKNVSDTPRASLDQIFHMLKQAYGRNEVNSQVAKRLKLDVDDSFHSPWHEIIMQLSADQEGNPQVVTTNFDLLFEYTSKGSGCPTHEPPAFPDILHGVPLKGITYLHGRLQEPEASHHSYVLSSADFGRAYLSEGWATSFIQSLLTSYTVVLLGYSAEDPPVKYLLQGLNHDGGADSSNLYAFDRGTQDEIDSKWNDRGVTAIAFSEYEQLWQSLEAWRDRAVSPREWREKVFQLALKRPQELLAHERGQVAHIVRTTSGAKLFAQAKELPPADWLCVFDRSCRVAKQSKDYGIEGEVFKPITVFGLDDDKQHLDSEGVEGSSHEHLLEWRRGDANPPHGHKLGNRGYASMNLPRRLEYITFWIAKSLSNPIVAWWAGRLNDIHPRVLDALSHRFRLESDMHPKARKVWSLMLESHYQHRYEKKEINWFDFIDHLKKEGWTKGVLRHFEEITKPYISIENTLGLCQSKPPSNDWEEIKVRDIVNFQIQFSPRHGESVPIPDEVLLEATQILGNNLVKAADLRLEIGDYDFESPTCYPNRDTEGRANSRHSNFTWFISLFERLKNINPRAACAIATLWPSDEKYYFSKLKMYAFNMNLFDADEAIRFLLELSQEQFWESETRRELLFLVHDRWNEFSSVNKTKLLTRLLDGPDKRAYWKESEYENRKNEEVCLYVKWLVFNGCNLPPEFEERLDEAARALPEWRDTWARNTTSKHFMQVRSIGTDASPAPLKGIPLNKLAQIAEACSKRDFNSDVQQRPFVGLVTSEPRRALASLSLESRRQKYPTSLWRDLISNWPNEVSGRLQLAFLNRILTLPREVVSELKHTLSNWLRERFLSIVISNEFIAWKLFDHCVDGFTLEIEQNELQYEVKRKLASASAGPVADLTSSLLSVLDHQELNAEQTIPCEMKAKLEALVSIDEKYRGQVVTILCRRVQWFFQFDPQWTQEQLLPRFDFLHDDAEAAWIGYAQSGGYYDAPVMIYLKPFILKVFPFLYKWGWEQNATNFFSQILVELTLADALPATVTAQEARHCIRSMNNDDRREVINRLSVVGKREDNGWSSYVVPFIDTVWPRERAFKTSVLTSAWLSLLARTGENFPNVLKSVHRFLAYDGENGHWLYQFKRDTDNEKSLAELFPKNVLEMLDAVIPNHIEMVPYDLEEVLNLTIESKPVLLHNPRYIRLITLIENI